MSSSTRLGHGRSLHIISILLILCHYTHGESIPADLLEEALIEGFRIAEENRAYESILGIQLRSGLGDLDSPSNQLFNFRKPETQSKTDSVCLGTSLLEVSKYLIRRLPGTTIEGVQRLQQQKLQSRVCQRLLQQSHDDCASVRLSQTPNCDRRAPYRSFDGQCNNLLNPEWGAASKPFSRYVRPFYEDGLDEIRGGGRPAVTALPSPRRISVVMSEGFSGRRKPQLRFTSLIMQFGQFMDHDLTHTPESAIRGEDNRPLPFGCCERGIPPSSLEQERAPDCRPIDLTGDAVFSRLGRRCMRFVRSLVADNGCKLGPREQLNQVTSFLDGSVLYGNSDFLSEFLRDKRGRGTLRHTQPLGSSLLQGISCPNSFCNAALLPEQRCHAQTSDQCFISGDGRANEQAGLTSLHILFMRIHNSVAGELGRINPRWNSDTVYQETRRILVALFQQVVYREFLPVLLGSGPMDHFNLWLETDGYFLGYNESVNPTTPNVFATAAFRFGHSLVDDVLLQTPTANISLLSSFNQPGILKQHGTRPAQMLQSLTLASSQDSDEIMVPTIMNNLFGSPRFPVGFDLYALNIMRGRDHGLGGYNEWRAACGLTRIRHFQDLTPQVMSREAATKLSSLYLTVDDVDLFPAALSEHPLGNGILGPTFACLIGQHFHDIKFGDRFWHENIRQPKPFSAAQLRELRKTWFVSMLCHHTNLDVMQPSPFIAADNVRNPLRSCPTYRRLDLTPWREGIQNDRPVVVEPPTVSKTPSPILTSTSPVTTPRPSLTSVRPRPSSTFRPVSTSIFTSGRPVTVGRPITIGRPSTNGRPSITIGRPTTDSRPILTGRPLPTGSISQTPISSTIRPPVSPTSIFTRPPISATQRPPLTSFGTSTNRPFSTGSRPVSPVESKEPTSGSHHHTHRPSAVFPVTSTHRPILPPFGARCFATGVWRGIPGMDNWCNSNCNHSGSSHCPLTHCRCIR